MSALGDALMAWLHFVLIFAVLGALVAELVLCRAPLTDAVIQRMARFDLAYGIAAGGLFIVGFGRASHFAKGWDFYATEPWFWVKLALFATVGLISIVPTVQLLKWRKAIRGGAALTIGDAEIKRLRRFIHAELSLFPLIALAATLMARGL
jgi:putative membrane protein